MSLAAPGSRRYPRFRDLGTHDAAACIDVAADREWETDAAQWSMLLRFGKGYGVEDADGLAGTVTIFPYPGVAFVGMLLVRRRLERQGWGRRLVEHALHDTGATAAALVATPFGLPLYEAMGFLEAEQLVALRGEWLGPPGGTLPRAAGSLDERTQAAIVEADADAFGTPRTPFVLAMLSRAPRVAVTGVPGALSYAMARHGQTLTQIGPVIAESDGAAFDLIASLASEAVGPCRIHVPSNRATLLTLLENAGLSPIARQPYLVRGPAPLPRPSWYAVGTKATG